MPEAVAGDLSSSLQLAVAQVATSQQLTFWHVRRCTGLPRVMAVKTSLSVAILLTAHVLVANSHPTHELGRAAGARKGVSRVARPASPERPRAPRQPHGSFAAQFHNTASYPVEADADVTGQSLQLPSPSDSDSHPAPPPSDVAATAATEKTNGRDPDAIIGGIDSVGSPDDAGQTNGALPLEVDGVATPLTCSAKS